MDDKIEKARSKLSDKELDAYRKYNDAGKPKLSPEKANQFYAIFLQGYDCAHIAKTNPGFDLGLIVKARVENGWDDQRDTYIQQLMEDMRGTIQKTTAEAIKFAADGMAAFHRLAGDRFRKYIQTGDTNDLGPFKELSFKNYKDMVELMLALTGQTSSSKKEVFGEVVHTHKMEEPVKDVEGEVTRTIDAAATLNTLAAKKKE